MSEVIQQKYGEALFDANETTICGVVLLPFSLGKLIILDYINSPFISADRQNVNLANGILALYQALIICALSYEEAVRFTFDEQFYNEIWDKFNANLKLNMDSEHNWNVHDKVRLFDQYLEYYLDPPEYNVESTGKDKANIPSGTDWKASIKMLFPAYSDSHIFNMNFRTLMAEWCSKVEADGAIKVIDKITADKMKAVTKRKKIAARMAEILRKRKAKEDGTRS